MKTLQSRRTTIGISLTTALGVIVGTGLAAGWSAGIASAALGTTQFEIDGDLAVSSGQDWESDPGSNANLRGAPFETLDDCGGGIDADKITPGNKLDDIDIHNPPVQAGNVNNKSDLCAVYQAWELAFVPDAGNPDPDAGQYQFIFYGAWSRADVNGEINVFFPLLGEDDTTQDDDLLIVYDFVDSSNSTEVAVLEWDGDSWEPTTLADGQFDAETSHGVVIDPVNGAQTFGEFAINLTLAGILPENGPCTSFTSGDPLTRTGNSASANLEDIVDAQPITLTNCGSLEVTKETIPAVPAGSTSFDIRVNELDGEPILGDGSTTIEDSLTVPTEPSRTYTDLLISPDYVVTETNVPIDWTQQSVICDSFDPIAGEDVTRTLYSNEGDGPDTSFPVAPGMEASCVIVNGGPPTVTVQKTTIGGSGGPFGFSVTDSSASTPLSATTASADTPTTVDEGTIVVAPGSVTVAESSLPSGFFAGDLTCTVTTADGSSPAPIVGAATPDGAPSGATFDLATGDAAACVQENLAAASVSVTKTVEGSASDWSFDFTISPVPVGEAATKAATAGAPTVTWGNLQPGVEYTITESPVDGYISGTIDCDGDAAFTPGPGEAVDCTIANTELAAVSVTKTVDGTAADWAFAFTISPVPAGGVGTKIATEASPTVSWSGLTPGADYTITETPVDGYITGVLECGGTDAAGTSTFTPAAGESVDCAITNTELGAVDVTKTVDGTSTDWSFDFTINPVPAGESATKTATVDSPTASWAGLAPGTDYTITEADVPGYISGEIDCGDGATFSPAPGDTTECAVTNTELGSVAVTKTVDPVESGWAFEFSIDPVPAGESATKTATSANPTTGWAGLVPGTEYTVTELQGSDLVTGTLACTDGTNTTGASSFTPTPGQAVSCSITNTRVADIEVVKTSGAASVLPGGSLPWTIQVTNNGPSTALDVELTDELPAELTLVSVTSPEGWDCSATVTGNPGTVSCSKPDMIPGESWSFTLDTTVTGVTGGETITNVATVTTTTDETTTDNNIDSASSTVETVSILPPTGGYVQTRLLLAGLLVAAGCALLLVQQRRREMI